MHRLAIRPRFTRREALAALALSQNLPGQDLRKPAPANVKAALPGFSGASIELLAKLLGAADFRGQLPAAAVKQVMAQERLATDQLMIGLLPLAQTFSRPPLSNYHVGAVLEGTEGNVYLGANLEVRAALGFSVHGEQSAACNAYMNGERGIAAVAVTAAPCGHCRQFLFELSDGHDIRILLKSGLRKKLSELLPDPFGPKDLGITESPFAPKKRSVSLVSNPAGELSNAALDMMRRSYAPYSKSPSGVALQSRSGRVHTGAYIENAAFNPSLSPLQVALVAMSMANEDFAGISRVVLVEMERAPMSQASATKAVMEAVAPAAQLQVLKAR